MLCVKYIGLVSPAKLVASAPAGMADVDGGPRVGGMYVVVAAGGVAWGVAARAWLLGRGCWSLGNGF